MEAQLSKAKLKALTAACAIVVLSSLLYGGLWLWIYCSGDL